MGIVIAPTELRWILGHFATGVTVITTRDHEGRPRGLTVNSFTSLSLDPPLVLVCVGHGSQTHRALHLDEAVFAVNILTQRQESLSRLFASKQLDKFQGVAYRDGLTGAPVLEDVLAYLECRVVDRLASGDHTIIVGEVCHASTGQSAAPLLFYHGRYAALAEGPGYLPVAEAPCDGAPRLRCVTAS